jgi:hypothetical protein
MKEGEKLLCLHLDAVYGFIRKAGRTMIGDLACGQVFFPEIKNLMVGIISLYFRGDYRDWHVEAILEDDDGEFAPHGERFDYHARVEAARKKMPDPIERLRGRLYGENPNT